ncbi:MAG: hypothetical protein JW832_17880 [Deltaproteobacteria bacterium]|nr:hypothetical protein [Deltaproteobacteria bacterium]
MTMTAQAYTIIRKKRRWFPEAPVSINDFILSTSSPLDAQLLLHSPQISMYCADVENKTIVFVETPPGLNVPAAPFYYLAQYEHATRALTLPFDDFIRLTEALPCPDKKFLFLYTVGRAGSTLLTKIFAGDPDTVAVSEPDILSDFSLLAQKYPLQKPHVEKLLLSCFKIFSSSAATAGKQRILIKPRGYCIEMGEIIHTVLPDAKGIFLYRNARPVIESFIRAFSITGVLSLLRDILPSRMLLAYLMKHYRTALLDYFPALSEYPPEAIFKTGWTGVLCITWLSIMKAYVRLYRKGIDVRAVLYEDIIKAPQELVARLFGYCDIPDTCLAAGLKALERDSQEGTRLARSVAHKKKWQMKEINMEHVRIILQSQPEISSPDYIVPGTIMHDSAQQ